MEIDCLGEEGGGQSPRQEKGREIPEDRNGEIAGFLLGGGLEKALSSMKSGERLSLLSDASGIIMRLQEKERSKRMADGKSWDSFREGGGGYLLSFVMFTDDDAYGMAEDAVRERLSGGSCGEGYSPSSDVDRELLSGTYSRLMDSLTYGLRGSAFPSEEEEFCQAVNSSIYDSASEAAGEAAGEASKESSKEGERDA